MDSPRSVVYPVLEDVLSYPRWWPQVRCVEPDGPDAHRVTARSVLPMDMVFTSHGTERDPDRGLLLARLSGDLEGWSRWRIDEDGDHRSIIEFVEVVTARSVALRWLAPIARPLFVFNHSVMMRHGSEGLRRYLASRP